MEIIAKPAAAFGYCMDSDGVLRVWNADRSVCALIELTELSWKGHFTLEIGFYSPIIATLRGEGATNRLPMAGHSSGFFFRPRDLGMTCPNTGWRVTSAAELDEVGNSISQELTAILPSCLHRFFSLRAWGSYCREMIEKYPCGHGRYWAMLGYVLLVDDTATDSDCLQVIECHSAESDAAKMQNKIPFHLDRQRVLLAERHKLLPSLLSEFRSQGH